MSLVIVELTDDGILLSADKRIGLKGKFTDDCLKAFPVNDYLAIGFTGKNVQHPKTLRALIRKKYQIPESKNVREGAMKIAELIADYNKKEHNTDSELRVIIVGYDGSEPRAYEVEIEGSVVRNLRDSLPYRASLDRISYRIDENGVTPMHLGDHILGPYKAALERHRQLFIKTAHANKTVSSTFNSYLARLEGIEDLGQL